MSGSLVSLILLFAVVAAPGCQSSYDVSFNVRHYQAPYYDHELEAHTLDFACAWTDAFGTHPHIRWLNVYWRDTVQTTEPVGGYLTDNGAHIAITERLEDSALWHEMAHYALCVEGDCDDAHEQASVWELVEDRR